MHVFKLIKWKMLNHHWFTVNHDFQCWNIISDAQQRTWKGRRLENGTSAKCSCVSLRGYMFAARVTMQLNTWTDIVAPPSLLLIFFNFTTWVREKRITWNDDPLYTLPVLYSCILFTMQYSAHFLCLVALLTSIWGLIIENKLIRISEMKSLSRFFLFIFSPLDRVTV